MSTLANLTTYFSGESASFLSAVSQTRGGLKSLIGQLDPASAATDRFNRQQQLLDNGLNRGKITIEQHGVLMGRLRQRYEENMQSLNRVTTTNGSARAGMQQLSYQLGDVATQFSMGKRPMMIFAQQGSQVIQALQLMTNKTTGLLGFLGGPWGVALSAAAVAVTPFISKLFEAGNAADDLKKKSLDAMAALSASTMAADQYQDAIKDNTKQYYNSMGRVAKANREIATTQSLIERISRSAGQGSDVTLQRLTARMKELQAERQAAQDARDQAQNRIEHALSQAQAKAMQDRARARLQGLGDTGSSGSGGGAAGSSGARAVSRAASVARGASTALEPLKNQVDQIMDRLFPEEARFNKFREELAKLQMSVKAGDLMPGLYEQAAARLRGELTGQSDSVEKVISEGLQVDILKDVKSLPDQIKDEWGRVKAANDNLGDSFATMSRNVTSSLQGLVNSIRSGDWLSSLQGVIDLIAQLGSTGIFGQSFAASMGSFRSFGGGREIGGDVMPMTDYLVGESGPEILRMGRHGGSIVPNDQIGGGTVQIVPSPYFDAVVDGRAARVASPIAQEAVNQNNGAQARRANRRFAG